MIEKAPLLEVKDLTLEYSTHRNKIRAVDRVSFTLNRGEVLGLVGESGCGKSSLAMTIMKLLPENARLVSGQVLLKGIDLVPLNDAEMREYRWRRISMVFQAAMNSLNPVYKVGEQITEALITHRMATHRTAKDKLPELFATVDLEESLLQRYPHEYSGGMKQRAIIAMALSCDPEIIIADEPTTALDVIVQDRILKKLRQIQKARDMSIIYISHDMAVVAEISDILGVMYAGKLVEMGRTIDIFKNPIHPYTEGLMASFPSIVGEKVELTTLPGEPPDLLSPPSGCHFHPRCRYATDICKTRDPEKIVYENHWATCWHPLNVKRDVVLGTGA